MKKLLILAFLFLLPALVLAEEAVREWKSKSGKTIISASLVLEETGNPETVYLLKDGKKYRIPLANLSEADQEYVTNARKNSASHSVEEDFGLKKVSQKKEDSRGMAIVERSRRYALLIGVNVYAAPIRPLKYCSNDMKTLSESFQKIGMPKENIFLMTDDSEPERRPTRQNIERQIESITQLMGPNDQLTIAFSGHGVMIDGKSYLCPSDTDIENPNSFISRDWAFEQMEKCQASQKIFIVDACRDEVAFGGSRALGDAKTLADPIGAKTYGFILIASCAKEQQSWEDEKLKHGVFTHFLAQGLSGKVAAPEGYISILNLFSYASDKTKKHVKHEFNHVQVPTIQLGGEMTDFAIAKLDASALTIEQTPGFITSTGQTAGERKLITVDGIEYAFRWCPPGTFMMGCPKSEWEEAISILKDYDKQLHEVTLTRGFWMLETEVTQAMWKSVMGKNPSYFKGGDQKPVERVSWDDCQEFCRKLSSKLGVTVTLPTEAQWEYACRAGTTGEYAGDVYAMAWYRDNSGRRTHPVGEMEPNAWGLYDMHGNICEWCLDWYHEDYYTESPKNDPKGPQSGEQRLIRGGSWNIGIVSCRSARRVSNQPTNRNEDVGVRVIWQDSGK